MSRWPLPLCAFALIVSGCSPLFAPRPDKSEFFVLSPIQDGSVTAASGASDPSIGLGPVKFPDYLNRPEVVTRVAANRLELSERHRWAEPLKQNFERVLSENLSILLGTREIRKFPWHRPAKIDYHITMDVYRFESDGSGAAHLYATWEIKVPETDEVLYSGRSDISQTPAQGESGPEALSRAEAQLSREIADALNQVRAAHPPSRAPNADSKHPA